MLGFLSFLAFLCAIAFLVSVVLLVLRITKKKSWKPCAIAAAAAVVCVLGLSIPISQLYVPAEQPDGLSVDSPSSEADFTANAAEKTTNVDKPVETVENQTAESSSENPTSQADPEQSVATEATDEADPAPAESSAAQETEPPADPAADDQPSTGTDAPSIAETYKTDVIVASKMFLDRFLSDYSVSLAAQSWTVADFDSEGAVIALADVNFKSSGDSARALLVLTPVIADGKVTEATPHFIAVGDTVYGDDGYCDSVFSTLQEALDAFGDSQ